VNYAKPNKFKIDGDTVTVFLSSPKYGVKECYVSLKDWPRVRMFKWHLSSVNDRNKTHYARASFGEGKGNVLMHRLILSFPPQIDHINHNGLDNRESNLRSVTSKQNARNKPVHNNCLAGVKGVRVRKYKNGSIRFGARIRVDGKLLNLGQSLTLEGAKALRAEAESKYFTDHF
jgi:hypothetical protein